MAMGDNSTKQKNALKEFKKGKERILENDFVAAKAHFKNAYNLMPKNAKYMSYYGLSIALSDGNPQVGVELCTRAINLDPENAVFFLNLAKIYIKIKDRSNAMQALKDGLKIDKDNPDIIKAFDNIGQRKEPAIPFMSRNNIMNVYLGRLKSFLNKL